MKVFITGITGFLGSHIAEVLLQAGHDVAGLARNPSAIDPDIQGWIRPTGGSGRLSIVAGSLSDDRTLEEAVSGADAVVHVAGLIQARSEEEYMRVNRDGVEAMMRAVLARSRGLRRFVLVSSQAAGGPARGSRPVTEQDPPSPVSAYGRSKLEGERRALARAGQLPVTILRPPVIFGPRDRMLAPVFASVARGRAAVWSDGSNVFNAVHAPDVARAARLALEVDHPTGTILYTGDDRPLTWRTFIESLGSAAGKRVRILRVPSAVFGIVAAASTAVAYVSGRPPLLSFDKLRELREPSWLCSSRAAREALGWSPSVRIEDALSTTFAWYRSRRLA